MREIEFWLSTTNNNYKNMKESDKNDYEKEVKLFYLKHSAKCLLEQIQKEHKEALETIKENS